MTLDPDDRVLVSTAFTEPAHEERVVGEVYLDGSVGRAGVYDMVSGGMKLSELLRTAVVLGDLLMDVRVERVVKDETVVVFQRTINEAADLSADDYDLLPDDHVFVERR